MHPLKNVLITWAICVAVPLVVWVIAELRWPRKARLVCGGILVAANLAFALFAVADATIGKTFEYNMWYSNAASWLVEAVVEELEEGNTDKVIAELTRLDEEFSPHYEQRGRWDERVKETIERLSQQEESTPTPP